MRIVLKGGVWKNTEDEILKAAVRRPRALALRRGALKQPYGARSR